MLKQPVQAQGVIEAAEMISPTVRWLRVRLDRPMPYVAGQWVNLARDGVSRSYSVASAPTPTDDVLEFAVTLVEGGPFSTRLHSLKVGDGLDVEGPFGFFVQDETHSALPVVFVGTGTGVAPLRAMVQASLATGDAEGPPMVLLFGQRSADERIFREEFEALSRQHPRFRYEVTLSRADDDWSGRRGYVQAHIADLVSPLGPCHVYICGLSDMVRGVRGVLKSELGFERKSVHSERYD